MSAPSGKGSDFSAYGVMRHATEGSGGAEQAAASGTGKWGATVAVGREAVVARRRRGERQRGEERGGREGSGGQAPALRCAQTGCVFGPLTSHFSKSGKVAAYLRRSRGRQWWQWGGRRPGSYKRSMAMEAPNTQHAARKPGWSLLDLSRESSALRSLGSVSAKSRLDLG